MFRHTQRLTDAIVLCGGLGERLRPLTEQVPKAMIPIGGRPILETIPPILEANPTISLVLDEDFAIFSSQL